MANIKLKDHSWEASGVYDIGQQKNQRQINAEQADLKSAINTLQPAATAADVGKALIVKTVADGKPTSYEYGEAGSGLTADVKAALLACFAKVAWIDENGQDYYDALDAALNPPSDLVRITATYTQTGTVYTTDLLDSLKPDLVVTAYYSDSTTAVITNYALSGTLSNAVSTITASYAGKTATFDVVVSVNLFNPATAPEVNLYVNANEMIYKVGTPAYYSTYVLINPNKTYKIEKLKSSQFRIATSQNEPAVNGVVTKTNANHNGTLLTIASESNDNYLFITYCQVGSAYDANTIRNSISIYELYGGV